ncbi:MAG: aminomethyl transferase family protein [Ignavibacteria bacterium]|nr:aminomethyl transferase family protein [Ignavibacteria bacterium]
MDEALQPVNLKTDIYKNIFPEILFGENGKVKVFNNTDKEYYSLTKGVAVRCPDASVLSFSGETTPDFLNRICTKDVKNLPDGKTLRTLFTNERGKVIDRTTFINLGAGEYILVGNSEYRDKLHSWIQNYIYLENIEKKDVSDDFLILEISGPQANSFLTLICGNLVDKIEDNSLTPCNADGFIFNLFKLHNIRKQEKYWLMIELEKAEGFIKYIIDNNIVFDLSFIGTESFNIFRTEMGIPASPNEINLSFNPVEIGLAEEVSLKKGSYIGQEVISKLDSYEKIQRNLTGVIFDEIPENPESLPVHLNDSAGNDAGKLTTLVYSKKLKKHIGLAVIKKNYIESGEKLFVKLTNSSYSVKTTKLPFEK